MGCPRSTTRRILSTQKREALSDTLYMYTAYRQGGHLSQLMQEVDQQIMDEQFSREQSQLVTSPVRDAELIAARPALALLARSRVLIAVALRLSHPQAVLEVTVSKAIDETGVMLAQYWWEVDRFNEDEPGQPCRQKRWGMSLHPHETAEAAYLAALEWVQAQTAPRQ